MKGRQGKNLSKAGTWRQEIKVQPWRNTANQLPNFSFLSLRLYAYITQTYLYSDGTAHSHNGLGSLTSTIYQENVPQPWL